MNDYSQPGFYRFNGDSMELVRWVLKKVNKCENLLDLGAGCGVVGIEIALRLGPQSLALVELQTDYISHIESNIKCLNIACDISQQAFSKWTPLKKYDLIVCNPPYYLPGRGEASQDMRRGISRNFVQDSWYDLLSCVERSLSEEGRAFMVLKNEREILKEVRRSFNESKLEGEFFECQKIVFIELWAWTQGCEQLRLNKE